MSAADFKTVKLNHLHLFSLLQVPWVRMLMYVVRVNFLNSVLYLVVAAKLCVAATIYGFELLALGAVPHGWRLGFSERRHGRLLKP